MEKRCTLSHISDTSLRSVCFRDFQDCEMGELIIEYESRYENTRILREVINEFCELFSLPAKWKTRLVLIYDELHNNTIEHGSLRDDNNICFISLTKKDSGIFIRWYVEDTWNASNSKSYKDMKKLQAAFKDKDFSKHNWIRWRGLFLIISQLVDILEFRPSSLWGIQVYFEKFIILE